MTAEMGRFHNLGPHRPLCRLSFVCPGTEVPRLSDLPLSLHYLISASDDIPPNHRRRHPLEMPPPLVTPCRPPNHPRRESTRDVPSTRKYSYPVSGCDHTTTRPSSPAHPFSQPSGPGVTRHHPSTSTPKYGSRHPSVTPRFSLQYDGHSLSPVVSTVPIDPDGSSTPTPTQVPPPTSRPLLCRDPGNNATTPSPSNRVESLRNSYPTCPEDTHPQRRTHIHTHTRVYS